MMRWIPAVLWRGLVLTMLWWVIVEGGTDYLAYGMVAVPLAVGASLAWSPPKRVDTGPILTRLAGWVRLVGWVLGRMVAGGIDVARRAMARPVDIDPTDVVVPVRLEGAARAFALAVFNLLPGTVVQQVDDETAVVHCLARDLDPLDNWDRLESLVSLVSAATGRPRSRTDRR